MRKICRTLPIALCLALLLSVNAFAAAPDETAYGGGWSDTVNTATTETTTATEITTATTSETATEVTAVTTDESVTTAQEPDLTNALCQITDDEPMLPDPIPGIEPDRPVGIPPREISNWLSEQIRLEVDYSEIYGTKDVTVVHLKLSDATKIIFIADQLCPTGYTEDGGYFASGIGIPCGINWQLYRYLDTTSRAAAMYDFDGATTLMAKYSPEELAAVYEDLREAAMPYHGELIEWMDNFSTTIRVPNYGTLWSGIIVPQPEPVEDVLPTIEPIEDFFPQIIPIEETIPVVVAIQ